MAINNMTVGRQYSITFYDPNTGGTVDLGDVQNFHITALKKDIESQPYNDDPRFGYIAAGYAFKFTIVRTNANLENYQLAQTALFDSGGSVVAGTLNETIIEGDGTASRYQYLGFVFWVSDIGDVTREAPVKMMAEGKASKKVRIA